MGKHVDNTTDDLDKLRLAVQYLKNCNPEAAKAVAATMSKQGKQNFIRQMRKFSA